MRKTALSFLIATLAAVSAKSEVDSVVVADRGGILDGFEHYEQVYLTNDHTLVYVDGFVPNVPDGTYVSGYRKNTKYYLPAGRYYFPAGSNCSSTGQVDFTKWSVPSSNRVVNGKSVGFLKRGEGFCCGDVYGGHGCLYYISGKDIPADIKCPDSYRQAQDIIHYVTTGPWCRNVLFDPIRKKQVNILYLPWGKQFEGSVTNEYDFPYFPYCKGMERIADQQAMKNRDVRLCELSKSMLAVAELPGKVSGPVLQLFPCDYTLIKEFYEIDGTCKCDFGIMTEAQIEQTFADRYARSNRFITYTNLLVSAVKKDNEWNVSALVAFGTNTKNENDADTIYLLDETGLLRMSGGFTYHSWINMHDADGNVVADKMSSECKFEERLEEVFNVKGEFTLERLLQRVKEDEERVREAREAEGRTGVVNGEKTKANSDAK